MGTPEFAVPPLQALIEAGHEVAAVVTQPDRQRDRGKKVQFSPVKETALSYGLSVWQPEKIRNNPGFVSELTALHADCFIVAAYGKILPKEILQLPRLGCINIHGSLLPKYRGAAPVHRAILAGEPVTGVTIMYMAEELDAGDMLSSRQTEIGGKTAAQLYTELSEMGAKLLVETLRDLEAGKAKRVKQDEALVSYAPMLTKEEGRMNFSRSAAELERQIRGLHPWPSAYTVYNGQVVKIWEAEIADAEPWDITGKSPRVISCVPGTILSADGKGIAVATGDGVLLIQKLQFPGKKTMDVKDYLLGNKIESGTRFGV
jgi:methionyl-tRNA formyltransferase